jgi:hypothetical protein
MGFGDFLNYVPGVSNVKGAIQGNPGQAIGGAGYAALHAAYNGLKSQGPPGVGGPIAPGQQPDGTWIDKATGNVLTPGPNGTFLNAATGGSYSQDGTPVAAPNVAQQTATANQNSQGFLGNLQGDRALSAQGAAGQMGLAASLNDTISNPQHSSVAANQLGASLDDTNRTQMAAAAGVGGPNAFAAHRQAMQNIAFNGDREAQAGALLRAQETASAQGQLGNVYGSLQSQGATQYGQDTGAATAFSGQAMAGAAGDAAAKAAAAKANQDLVLGAANGGAGAATKLMGL